MQEHTQEQPPITSSVCYWRQHSHRCLAGCLPSARSSSTVRYSSTRGWSRCHTACAGRSMLYVPLCSCSLCCPAYRWWPGQRSDWSHLDKEKNKTNQFHLFSVIKNKRQRSFFFSRHPFAQSQRSWQDITSAVTVSANHRHVRVDIWTKRPTSCSHFMLIHVRFHIRRWRPGNISSCGVSS